MTKHIIPKAHVDEKIKNAETIAKYLSAAGLPYFAENVVDIVTFLAQVRDGKIEVV